METLGMLNTDLVHPEPTQTGKDVLPQEPAIAMERCRPASALLRVSYHQLGQFRETATLRSLSTPLGQRIEAAIDEGA